MLIDVFVVMSCGTEEDHPVAVCNTQVSLELWAYEKSKNWSNDKKVHWDPYSQAFTIGGNKYYYVKVKGYGF